MKGYHNCDKCGTKMVVDEVEWTQAQEESNGKIYCKTCIRNFGSVLYG